MTQAWTREGSEGAIQGQKCRLANA
jgi:hypothetical protein